MWNLIKLSKLIKHQPNTNRTPTELRCIVLKHECIVLQQNNNRKDGDDKNNINNSWVSTEPAGLSIAGKFNNNINKKSQQQRNHNNKKEQP